MIERRTIFSVCRNYRFTLWRKFQPSLLLKDGFVQFIGLNPSTADETVDDPTVRRCIGFARAWGYGELCMTNLFAFRATQPAVMKQQASPIGADNTAWLIQIAKEAETVVAAWGTDGSFSERGDDVSSILKGHGIRLHCLGRNQDGTPKHPLYLSKTLSLIPY